MIKTKKYPLTTWFYYTVSSALNLSCNLEFSQSLVCCQFCLHIFIPDSGETIKVDSGSSIWTPEAVGGNITVMSVLGSFSCGDSGVSQRLRRPSCPSRWKEHEGKGEASREIVFFTLPCVLVTAQKNRSLDAITIYAEFCVSINLKHLYGWCFGVKCISQSSTESGVIPVNGLHLEGRKVAFVNPRVRFWERKLQNPESKP